MTDVKVDRLALRLSAGHGRDGRRLAEAVGAALGSLASLSGPLPASTLRVRVRDDSVSSDEELAARIVGELLRAAGQPR